MTTSAEYKPGVFTKGEQTRIANTPADAVQLRFDGFSLQGDAPAEVLEAGAVGGDQSDAEGEDYRALQARAKDAGIPANQSAEALKAALGDA